MSRDDSPFDTRSSLERYSDEAERVADLLLPILIAAAFAAGIVGVIALAVYWLVSAIQAVT